MIGSTTVAMCVVAACALLISSRYSSSEDNEMKDRFNKFLRLTTLKTKRKVYHSGSLFQKDYEEEVIDYAYCYKIIECDSYYLFFTNIPEPYNFSDLQKLKQSIAHHFKKEVTLEMTKDFKYVVKVYKHNKKELANRYNFNVIPVANDELFITVGMTSDGPLNFNISQLPHVLLAGTSGSGKSRLLKAILCNLIENYSPDQLELVYLDNKGTECGAFKNVEHLIHRTNNIYDTIRYLDELAAEMMRRNRLIESKNKTNIIDYNKVVSKSDRIPFRFVVIDELFPFLALTSKDKNEAYSKLALLLSMSRASGIHFLLATQKATIDVLPSMLTANCTVQIGLRCRNEQESRNAIGESGLEKISVAEVGRGVAVSHIKQEFQSFWITDEVIEKICYKHYLNSFKTLNNQKDKKHFNAKKTTLDNFNNNENNVLEGVL